LGYEVKNLFERKIKTGLAKNSPEKTKKAKQILKILAEKLF
jgi:hypothetical protein